MQWIFFRLFKEQNFFKSAPEELFLFNDFSVTVILGIHSLSVAKTFHKYRISRIKKSQARDCLFCCSISVLTHKLTTRIYSQTAQTFVNTSTLYHLTLPLPRTLQPCNEHKHTRFHITNSID